MCIRDRPWKVPLVLSIKPFACDTEAVSYTHLVSLSASQSYTISHNGFGDVLNFATGVQNYYDRMAGVDVYKRQYV